MNMHIFMNTFGKWSIVRVGMLNSVNFTSL